MSIAYRPPFDEDDERDLRALYRRPDPGASPELDAAVRRSWHPGHSWHPAWGAAACAAMVAGLFAWTDMREAQQEYADPAAQLTAPHESAASQEAPATAAAETPAPAAPAMQRAAVEPPAQEAASDTQPQAEAAPAEGEAAAAEPAPFSDEDIEARAAHIRALMQAGQQEEAVQALRELQQGAPDLALPDDLQELADRNPA